MGTPKPYMNMVIGALAVDGWADIWYNEEGPAALTNLLTVPSTASVPTSYNSMLHYNYFCTPKG